MQVLAIAPVLPYPATDGLRLVIAEHLAELTALGHQLTLVCIAADSADAPVAPHEVIVHSSPSAARVQRGAHLATSLFSALPYLIGVVHSSSMQQTLDELVRRRRYDLMYIEHLNMTPYAAIGRRARLPVVLAAHNVESTLFARISTVSFGLRRWHYRRQAQLLAAYEASLSRHVDHVVTLSATDAAQLQQLDPVLPVTTIAPALDLHRLPPGLAEEEETGAVVMTGVMSFPPNVDAAVWFSTAVWPLVLHSAPQARLYLVGKQPVAALRRLDDGKTIHVIGAVPEIRPWLTRAQVVVAPLRAGSGVRIKLLEAMAMEKAIVATTIGAEGLAVQHGRELLLAERPEQFAAAVVDLLQDAPQRAALGAAARRLVQEQHAPAQAAARLDQLLQQLVGY